MLTKLNSLKHIRNHAQSISRSSVVGIRNIAYCFQMSPDSQIYDQYLQSKDIGLKNASNFNGKFQRATLSRYQPTVEQIQSKLQNQWKNKKLIFNIDPSALIGHKRLFMKRHLEQNVYKNLSTPDSLFSQINPSSDIATEQLKFDGDNFLLSDPIAIKLIEENQGQSQQKIQQLIRQKLSDVYENQPDRFPNRLKSNLNVPQPYSRLIELGLYNQNSMYFCGINEYAFRNLLSKFLKLNQVRQLFMISLKFAQSQSFKHRLQFPTKTVKLEDRYQTYARELIYLNHFKIIKQVQNGEIIKRLNYISRIKQGSRRVKTRGRGAQQTNNNIVVIGHSYTIDTLDQYTLIQDLQSQKLNTGNVKISQKSINSAAPLQKMTKQQKQTDSQKIQKHAILEVMLGNLWNQPYTFNRFPYLSESYEKLNEQDKNQVKQIYHEHLTKYTGAKRLYYQQNIKQMQSMAVNSPAFARMKGSFEDQKEEYLKNKQNIDRKAKEIQKRKLKIDDQLRGKSSNKKDESTGAYSEYPDKYEQNLQQLLKINLKAEQEKQKVPQKQPRNKKYKKQQQQVKVKPEPVKKSGRATRSARLNFKADSPIQANTTK